MPKRNHKEILPKKTKPKNFWENIFFYILIFAVGWTVVSAVTTGNKSNTKPISDILNLVKQNKVQKLEVEGNTVTAILKDDGGTFQA